MSFYSQVMFLNTSSFVHKSGESPQIESVGDFIHFLFSSIARQNVRNRKKVNLSLPEKIWIIKKEKEIKKNSQAELGLDFSVEFKRPLAKIVSA